LKIAAVATAFPPHWYEQRVLTECLVGLFGAEPRLAQRLRSLHANTGVRGRYLTLPLDAYGGLTDFTRANAAWLDGALELGERACRDALARAGVAPAEVDTVLFSTVTGLASPSLDARLVTRLGLRPDVRRVPMFGLGCVAGAACVSRAADYVKGQPDGTALVLTLELCSLTLQREDHSVANLISSGLFGDGAAAAVVVGERHRAPGPRVVDTRSVFYPDTEDVMGWNIGAHGFRIVLSPDVPAVARERVPADVDAFLRPHRLARGDIARWIAHPGGPKVLEALQQGLGVGREQLEVSWQCLADAGNLSSASVLMILERTMRERPPAAGEHGVLLAMGPGFCSELLLLRW
jgi:alkylresorcinol/alkylpyrone synthase